MRRGLVAGPRGRRGPSCCGRRRAGAPERRRVVGAPEVGQRVERRARLHQLLAELERRQQAALRHQEPAHALQRQALRQRRALRAPRLHKLLARTGQSVTGTKTLGEFTPARARFSGLFWGRAATPKESEPALTPQCTQPRPGRRRAPPPASARPRGGSECAFLFHGAQSTNARVAHPEGVPPVTANKQTLFRAKSFCTARWTKSGTTCPLKRRRRCRTCRRCLTSGPVAPAVDAPVLSVEGDSTAAHGDAAVRLSGQRGRGPQFERRALTRSRPRDRARVQRA